MSSKNLGAVSESEFSASGEDAEPCDYHKGLNLCFKTAELVYAWAIPITLALKVTLDTLPIKKAC